MNKNFSKWTNDDLKFFNEEVVNGTLTILDLINDCDELIYDGETSDPVETDQIDFWTRVQEDIQTVDSTRLKDKRDIDGYSHIKDIMETLHYDNGEPLCCTDWDFFEHYDRDQEFWGFFSDVPIDSFDVDNDGNLLVIVDMTYDQLKSILTDRYDGSSWEHDFGESTPDEVRYGLVNI